MDRPSTTAGSTVSTAASALTITRTFDAPRERVWMAWTEPAFIREWWGPKDFTAPSIDVDFRVGGKYLYCMRDPDKKDYWSTGTFKKITPREKIVVMDSFADEKGNVVPASHYGMEGLPLTSEVRFTFEDVEDGKTRLTVHYPVFPPGTMKEDASAGWNQSLDKLAGVVEAATLFDPGN